MVVQRSRPKPVGADPSPLPSGPRLGLLTIRDRTVAVALFLLALLCYLRTTAGDVLFSDSGEFNVLSVTGGLAHPTGYPVFLGISKLFTFLPFGTLAFRSNLVSTVFASLAVAMVYLVARAIGVRRTYAALGALVLLFNPLFWWQSSMAEVYTTTSPFLLGFLLCAILWRARREPKWLAYGGFLGGICLGMHHAALLSLPFVIAFLIMSKGRLADWKAAGAGALAGVAIAFAGYMVMASIENHTTATNSIKASASAYGLTPEDFDSPLRRVAFTLTAKQFTSELTKFDGPQAAKNCGTYVGEALRNFGWVALILAAGGLVTGLARKESRPVTLLIGGTWFILFAFAVKYEAADLEVEFLMGYVLLCLLIPLALRALDGYLLKRRAPPRWTAVGAGVLIFASGIPILTGAASTVWQGKITFLPDFRTFFPSPIHEPHVAHQAASDVVGRLAPNAILISTWEMEYPVYYVALFEANRPDIEVVEWTPVGTNGRPAASMLQMLSDNYGKRPLYAYDDLPSLRGTEFVCVPVPGSTPLYLLRRR